MTGQGRHVCDRPEPCGRYAVRYAAGRDKADFEVLASLDVLPHADGCACQPCQVKRACLQRVMTLLAKTSPGLFDQVEAWAKETQRPRAEAGTLVS